ncbi:unnamed protein product [Hymenolepis diminuta]|uniref:Uncharacterized protein n=1 Tax=Hymenolepis diminuta TaxID=6216 RepID=A0A564Y0Q3_HYMDI|nr:unnamed protein product [Hymenolepis diminuta]
MRLAMLLLMMLSPVSCILWWLIALTESLAPCVRTNRRPGTDMYRKDSLCGSESM